ncbi:MAG: hypothetical protein HC923_02605 [Myxococcales bacterium]|nr:hypothetical protein [Myxococcales bacterium]
MKDVIEGLEPITRVSRLPTLEDIADAFVRTLTDSGTGIREGEVMTPGPPPYRRLDCDARALCYVRVRPKKKAVRWLHWWKMCRSAICPRRSLRARGVICAVR